MPPPPFSWLASNCDWLAKLPMIVAPAGIGSLTTTQLRSAVASTVIVTRATSPRVHCPFTRWLTGIDLLGQLVARRTAPA